jgi:putative DNA primase/helicase
MMPSAVPVYDSTDHYREYGEETLTKSNSYVSFDDVKQASLGNIDMIVERYLSNPKLVDGGKEWTARNPTRGDKTAGTFKINRRTGVWSDFATKQSGANMIDLVIYLTGKTSVEAKDELADLLGVKPSTGSTSLTGNIPPAVQKPVDKVVAEPSTLAVAPTIFPPRTQPNEDGKPKFFKAGDKGPRPYSNEKRRHVYCKGGVPIKIKIMKHGEERAFIAYRVGDADSEAGWQFSKPHGLEEVPYVSSDNPFGPNADIERIVFWTEGEKDTDTISKLGGLSFSFGGTGDGLPKGCELYCVDRNIVIVADNDVSGREHAEAKAALASKVAASVRVISFPELPAKGDVSDWIEGGKTFANLKECVIAAGPWTPSTTESTTAPVANPEAKLPYGYTFTRRGLEYKGDGENDKSLLLAGHFDIEAMTRDGDGHSWGKLLRWKDDDGREHRHAVGNEMLAGDGAEARKQLLDRGLYVANGKDARARFNAFLLLVTSPNRALATETVGWNGDAFVLPDECFGGKTGETLLLQSSTAHEHSFRQAGTLEDWQEIPRLAYGNSRLVLATSMAFAGPLLGLCGEEGGGVHYVGPSSIGKTTALRVAAGVWGRGDMNGFVKSWRATANGLEGVCVNHSDTLLCLDEMAQITAKEAGEAAYMMSNGSGKSRSSRDGSARKPAKFRVLFLSSGEIGLADKVAEDGRGKRVSVYSQSSP